MNERGVLLCCMALLIKPPFLVDIFSVFCFCLKVSNFVEEEDVPVEILSGEPEVDDEGYFYEDIPEDEGFVSEGPWTSPPDDEYSSITPVTGHQDSGDVSKCQDYSNMWRDTETLVQ